MKEWNVAFKQKVSEKDHVAIIELGDSVARSQEFTPWHYITYISALYAKGSKKQAAEVIAEAIEGFPENIGLRIRHAENAMFSSNWQIAILRWQHIVEHFEHYPEGVLWRLALAHSKALEFDKARKLAEKIEEKYGSSQKLSDLFSSIDSAEAKKFIVTTSRNLSSLPCHLEKVPENKKIARKKDFFKYRLRGWVKIPNGKKHLLTLTSSRGEVTYLEFNVERPDVKKRFESKEGYNASLKCGFDYYIDMTGELSVGILGDEIEEWLFNFKLKGLLSVLEGKEGWLFLDNDVNDSVNQFTGKAKLSESTNSAWKGYAEALLEYQKKYNFAYFIASSKEAVVPQFYPYQKGADNIPDRIKKLLSDKRVNSISLTRSMSEKNGTYYKTDTHWSDYGAYLGYRAIMKECGFDKVITDVSFKDVEITGDLGSKLLPERRSPKKELVYDGPAAVCTFTNGMSGAGSIEVWENSKAHYSKTVLLFGDSFLRYGCLLRYFGFSFSRIVVLNLPGSLIDEIVNYESPDLLVVQTNDRYLSLPGRIYEKIDSCDSPVCLKFAALSELERSGAVKSLSKYTTEIFYKNKMLEVISKSFDARSNAEPQEKVAEA